MGILVQEGRLVFPKEVVGELERTADPRSPDPQFQWAKQHEPTACTHGAPTLQQVKDILSLVPKVLDVDKDTRVEEADPYVLAMASRLLNEGKNVRIVTEETKEMPRKMSLRTAAGLLRIPSVPLRAFLGFEGIGHF
jgi:Domain of unknown function (DUF4411)